MLQELFLELPRHFTRLVKRALLAAIGLERLALLTVRAGFEHSPDPRARLCAELDAALEENALLREEARILRARMSHLPPRRRPQYPPVERLAILLLRAKHCWNAVETARRFQVTAETIASWMGRLEEQGPATLVQTREPVTKFDDVVTALVQRLHQAAPHKGRRKLAQLLATAGLRLAQSTVARMLKTNKPVPSPPPPAPGSSEGPVQGAVPNDSGADDMVDAFVADKPPRVVTANRPHHVWHVDITSAAIGLPGAGFWVAWWPFAFVMRWALSWHIALVLDHYTRQLLAFRVLRCEPSAHDVCALLEEAAMRAATTPRYIISDQGAQFQGDYRAWCKKRGVRQRFGAVGQHGSIAIIERFILSLKQEFLRRIHVPATHGAMVRAVGAYQLWYNLHRPHSALDGRTPQQMLGGVLPPRQRQRIEPRPRYPLQDARASGGDRAPPARRPRGKLELVVSYVGGHRELPVVELREAA